MRHWYAKWLVDFTDEHGIGLGRGELAEVLEAELRLYGVSRVWRSEVPAVKSDLKIGSEILGWEPDLLTSIADELIPVLTSAQDDHDGE